MKDDKANVFQQSFSSFYTKDNGCIPEIDRLVPELNQKEAQITFLQSNSI
jgi:SMC interacting uncharacterized protein involved in chromosome segregation